MKSVVSFAASALPIDSSRKQGFFSIHWCIKFDQFGNSRYEATLTQAEQCRIKPDLASTEIAFLESTNR